MSVFTYFTYHYWLIYQLINLLNTQQFSANHA